MPRSALALLALLVTCSVLLAEDAAFHPKDPRVIDTKLPDLSEFRSVDTAIATRVSQAQPSATPSQPGYLGISVELNPRGQLVIVQVEADSPAAKAGLRTEDLLVDVAGQKAISKEVVGDVLRSKAPNDTIKINVIREQSPLELSITLAAASRPLSASSQRASLGIQVAEATEGIKIDQIMPNSPAASAGIKTGDLLLQVDGKSLTGPDQLTAALSDKQPGDTVALVLKRDGKTLEMKVRLAEAGGRGGDSGGQFQWNTRSMRIFRKPTYRLAVVAVEYPDVKHNSKVSTWDWEQALFSQGVYFNKSPTGQQVYGSMNDYYLELSCGTFGVEGRVFDWVTVGKKRSEYTTDTSRSMLGEAIDKLQSRDGKDALKDFDGIFFVHAGDRVSTNRGGLFWPHRASMSHQGKRWDYFICPEGAGRFSSISVIAHEFGHMLGLPDLYARPESPGSEGLGLWCTMSYGHGRDGKPLHFSAWCKEQMGWLKPTPIDPTIKQKLVLAPIENSPKECFKVLIRPDGSEYLLLENRASRGFDRDLPAEGLLIWRIVDGRPALEESHGIAGPIGPERHLGSVPFPSRSNNAFTPYTTPSSKSQKGGGLPVYITNIHRLPDGKITFHIGYEYF